MIIEKVEIHNFGRIKDLKYKFNRPGLNVIKGENGSGKTSIINAFFWCLIGKSLKKGASVGTWEIYRDKGYDGTLVKIKIITDKTYEVYRCQDYKGMINNMKGKNSIFIKEDGRWMDELRDKSDAEKFLRKLIGCSPELFKNTILFGQKLKRIIQYDGPKKKEIMEEAFGAQFISTAKDIASNELMGLNNDYEKLDFNLSYLKKDYEKTKMDLSDEICELNEYNAKVNFQRELAHEKIELLNSELSGLRAKEVSIYEDSELTAQLIQVSKLIDNTLEDKIRTLENNVKFLSSEISSIHKKTSNLKGREKNPSKCGYCGSVLKDKSQKDYLKKVNEEKKELKALLIRRENELSEVTDKLTKMKERQSSQVEYLNKYNDLKNEKEQLEKAKKHALSIKQRIYEVETEIRQEKRILDNAEDEKYVVKQQDKIRAFKEQKKKLKASILSYKEQMKPLKKEIQILKWVLDDALSNKGLKSFIFDSMLKILNHKLLQYNAAIGFDIKMGIDLESARKDFYITVLKKDLEVLYEDLSGGEQQLVDVAIALSLHDIQIENTWINILIMDEVFESLDENNIEKVERLLIQKTTHNKSIHLITHLKGFNPVDSYKTELRIDSQGFTEVYAKLRDI